jgi:hypothetical protein
VAAKAVENASRSERSEVMRQFATDSSRVDVATQEHRPVRRGQKDNNRFVRSLNVLLDGIEVESASPAND